MPPSDGAGRSAEPLAAGAGPAEAAGLLDALPDALCAVDRRWRVWYANARAGELFADRVLVGERLDLLLPRSRADAVWSALDKAMHGHAPVACAMSPAVLGEWMEVRASPFRDGLVIRIQTLEPRRIADAERADLLALAERSAVQAATLQRLTAALSPAVNEEQIGAVVLQQALPAFGATAGDVILLEQAEAMFRVLCWVGYPDELVRPWMRYPVDSGTPGGDVVRTGDPIFLSSIDEWHERYPRIAPIVGGNQLSAYAGLPLSFGGRVRGVVSFNFPSCREFRDEERTMLLAFAAQCAQALERAQLFAAERQARRDAEAAARAKSDFLAVMSHELRTPLTAILGYQELLADGITGPVTDTQRQQLERIEASAVHLLGLIDELLTFSRLEAGRETVQWGAVPVRDLLNEAMTLVAPLASGKPLTLSVHPPEPPTVITTDHGKLRQVLVNLLSNAVKFTDRGSVTLTGHVETNDVVIEVRDTGIGIGPEHRERIFEPFWQVEQHPTRRVSGTGLGLSVARALVQLLGGTIDFQSTPGAGSSFSVCIPRAPLLAP